MNLQESINRIKLIMFENVNTYHIVTDGEINSQNGMKVIIKNNNGDYIGETTIIDYENGLSLSPNFTEFMKVKNDMFNSNNSVYQHSLKIKNEFQKQGWGEKLKLECHNMIKNDGYKYATNIVKCGNIPSQNLMNKLGYKKYQTNGVRDLLYFEL